MENQLGVKLNVYTEDSKRLRNEDTLCFRCMGVQQISHCVTMSSVNNKNQFIALLELIFPCLHSHALQTNVLKINNGRCLI